MKSRLHSSKLQRGVSLTEYALVVSFISVVTIGSVTTFGEKMECKYQSIVAALDNGSIFDYQGIPCVRLPDELEPEDDSTDGGTGGNIAP